MNPSQSSSDLSPSTLCIHAGHRPSKARPEVVAPIVQSTTFLSDDDVYAMIAEERGDEALIYTRYGNPTLENVQTRLARLEGAEASLVFSSGMAAMHAALMACLQPGDHVLAAEQLYGGNWELLTHALPKMGFAVTLCDVEDLDAFAAAARPETRLVICESISNPTMAVADLPRIADIAHAVGAKLLVDATFATPILQRPLELAADLVLHSASKYLSGHSDIVSGVVSGSSEDMKRLRSWLRRAGGCMDPHAAFLLERGLKTLALRVRAHCEGAARLASFLSEHERVERVLYPGLATHPTHELGQRLMRGFGGMMSFVLRGDDAAATRVAHRLEIALEAPSLGGVETLVSLPCYMSHSGLTPEERGAAGIPPGMMRLSVGIEDPDDLIADFAQALRE